jgi:hypothetical protein
MNEEKEHAAQDKVQGTRYQEQGTSKTHDASDKEYAHSQPQNMEVHKHPHHVTHKKKWGEYVLEFLMIFLAVTLGFFAENMRENIANRHQEKQYISSFIEDLKKDTSLIAFNINVKKNKMITSDSLISYLNAKDPNQYGRWIYLYARQLTRTTNFWSTDRTLQQLKNTGGLRLIKNQQASDSIISYEMSLNRIYLTQSREEEEIKAIQSMTGQLLNPDVLETMIHGESIDYPSGNPPLRNTHKDLLLDFIYGIHQLKTSDIVNSVRLSALKDKAVGIILFLQREYHLKNE